MNWKMIISMAFVASLLIAAGKDQKTEWLESPVTIHCDVTETNSDGSAKSWEQDSILINKTDPTVQIGLREDGTVVWRKTNRAK